MNTPAALTPHTLALADLEVTGVYGGHGRERRFPCPFCGAGKKPDASHRSLSANTETGLWRCHRCGSQGLLREFRTASSGGAAPRQDRRRAALRQATALPSPSAPPSAEVWDRSLSVGGRWFQSFALTSLTGGYTDPRAAIYLRGRGLDPELAEAAGVRFCPDWFGRLALTFPLYDGEGRLTAAQGRYLDGRENPKTRSVGEIGRGVFATSGAWEAPAVVLTEAPLDALSLAACGLPALSLCGKDVRPWLLPKLAFRRVVLALDADAAGDAAAAAWGADLSRFGASVSRLRPEGGKDWNEVLSAKGHPALRAWVSESVPRFTPEMVPPKDLTPQDSSSLAPSLFGQVCRVFAPVTILD